MGTPIKHKDLLKSRRYRWNPEGRHKAWSIDLIAAEALEKLKFLWQIIYAYQVLISIEMIQATDRHSKVAHLPQYWIKSPEQFKKVIEC